MRSLLRDAFRTGQFPKARLEMFSDGVMAIVITILVLEFHLPPLEHDTPAALWEALRHLFPEFLSYIVSFFYIAIYWINHHHLFHVIERADRGLLWLNSCFLLCVTFIPFPTGVIGKYYLNPVAIIFYGMVMFLTALSFVVMKWYAEEVAGLIDESAKGYFKQTMFKIVAGPALYAAALLFAFIAPQISLIIYVLIPIIYFFPSKVEREMGHAKKS